MRYGMAESAERIIAIEPPCKGNSLLFYDFALSGRMLNPIATQGDTLGYELMPLRGAYPRI